MDFVVDEKAQAPRVVELPPAREQTVLDSLFELLREHVGERPPQALFAAERGNFRRLKLESVDVGRAAHHKNGFVGTVGDCVQTPAAESAVRGVGEFLPPFFAVFAVEVSGGKVVGFFDSSAGINSSFASIYL